MPYQKSMTKSDNVFGYFVSKLTNDDVKCIALMEEKYFAPAWSERMISSETDDKNSLFLVCKDSEGILGYVSFKYILDEGEINRVCVDEAHRNRGIASYLMDSIMDFCKQKNISKIFLEVRQSNYKAINLYKKYGFGEYSVRKAYYRDNKEDALLMMKDMNL